MNKNIVGNMSEWSGVFKDLFRQVDDGSVTLVQLQDFLEHRDPFGDVNLLSGWGKFYREVFGLKVDLSGLRVLPARQQGFDRLIVVAPGMTPQRIYDKCMDLFLCWKWTDKNLDTFIKSDRTPKDGPYAIWVRDRVEADEELKNLSANEIKQRNIQTMTFKERVLYELKFFKETGKHLDIDNVTLCAGSRYDGGYVPYAYWFCDEFRVYWCNPDDSSGRLRSRQAVS